MTWERIVSAFGAEDADPRYVLLRLAVDEPRFGVADLLGVFEVMKEKHRTEEDVRHVVMEQSLLPGGGVSSAPLASYIAALQKQIESDTRYSSDIVFRNLFRICFETSEWDAEILFQPSFLEGVLAVVRSAREDAERQRLAARQFGKSSETGLSFASALDFYEKIAEFSDRLAEKVRTAS